MFDNNFVDNQHYYPHFWFAQDYSTAYLAANCRYIISSAILQCPSNQLPHHGLHRLLRPQDISDFFRFHHIGQPVSTQQESVLWANRHPGYSGLEHHFFWLDAKMLSQAGFSAGDSLYQ